jgi:hypothetical protein
VSDDAIAKGIAAFRAATDDHARSTAVDALAKLGPDAKSALINLMADTTLDAAARFWLMRGLGKIDWKQGVDQRNAERERQKTIRITRPNAPPSPDSPPEKP